MQLLPAAVKIRDSLATLLGTDIAFLTIVILRLRHTLGSTEALTVAHRAAPCVSLAAVLSDIVACFVAALSI